jgi:AraC-like DNA-binding protein
VLDHFVWQEKVKNADYRLLQPLEGVARQLLSASESNARFARKVQAIIVQHLDGRVPGIEPVARQLALSPRTLQRRLKAENTSFHQVSAQARLQLAERYLEEGLPVGEVAYLLGFSLPNAFSRWFKSRKGVTPLTYRRQIKSGISP